MARFSFSGNGIGCRADVHRERPWPGLLASLSLVLPQGLADKVMVERIAAATTAGAKRIEAGLEAMG